MAIPLGRPLPDASRDRPGRRRGNPLAGCPACRPYLVLLPVGFAVPLALPLARWALTPPFHPCLAGEPARRRSEEHTSELQSQFHLVCRLLLEKKNKSK